MTDNKPPDVGVTALLGRDRIRGATRMIKEGTDARDVTPEMAATVAQDLDVFCRNYDIKQQAASKGIGYSPAVISNFIRGNYEGDVGQVALDVEAWISEEEERRNRPSTTQFVWTNVAQEIRGIANYCLDYRKIGLVYGPDTSGIGKTTALQAIYQTLGPRRCSLVTINKVDANSMALLRKICRALRLDNSGGPSKSAARIRAKLKGSSHLLLIDQIHNLRGARGDRPLYDLTDLWDDTQTAQLWCGTADMVHYLERQSKRMSDESLVQIRRRIFPCHNLMDSLRGDGTGDGDGGGKPLVTVEQVREMFARNSLKLAAPAARFLAEICNQPDSGGIGLCVQIVEYATMIAGMTGAAVIDLPLLKAALRKGFSPKRADDLLNRMHAEQQTPPRAAKGG